MCHAQPDETIAGRRRGCRPAVVVPLDHPLLSVTSAVWNAFITRFPRCSGRCFLVAPGAAPQLPGTDGIGALPLDLLLLAIGAQTEKEMAARLGAQSIE
jgi:hypothetical protein